MKIEKLTEEVNANDAISGEKMAAYLRQIADAIEPSDKLFTAKLKITVVTPSWAR